MRAHSFHPDVLFRDARTELSDPHSWGTSSGAGASVSTDDVARLVATCIRLDHSYQGPKDPEEIVRAALERDGEVYYPPSETSSALSMRAFLSGRDGIGAGSGNAARALYARRGSRGDSESDVFGSTPRARMRDRLYPHLAPLTANMNDLQGSDTSLTDSQHTSPHTNALSSSYSYTYPHRSFDSPIERSYTPAYAHSQDHELPLLFSHTQTYTPSPLSPTEPSTSSSAIISPPPGRSSVLGSRQSSLERGVTAANSSISALLSGVLTPQVPASAAPSLPVGVLSGTPHARHSPLAHPSPLSLSSMPLPEVSPEGSPEDDRSLPPADEAEEPQTSDVASGDENSGSVRPPFQTSLSPPPPSLAIGLDPWSSSEDAIPQVTSPAALGSGSGTPTSTTPISPTPNTSSSSVPMLSSNSAPAPSSSTFTSLSSSKRATPVATPSPSPDPPSASASTSQPQDEETKRALETLHRENVRLKDLNLLTLWMREETKKHIERLHKDRVILTGEEMERQNLVSYRFLIPYFVACFAYTYFGGLV